MFLLSKDALLIVVHPNRLYHMRGVRINQPKCAFFTLSKFVLCSGTTCFPSYSSARMPMAGTIPNGSSSTTIGSVERPALASKTREAIDANLTRMFDPLTRGKNGELFGSGSNLSPDDILAGRVVVIDIPVAR
jgi:hypothetical protein